MRIGIIGLGHIGLVTALFIAQNRALRVVGFDTNQEKVNLIQDGIAPFSEPQIETMLQDRLEKNSFVATSKIGDLSDCEIIFIVVDTNSNKDGSADLTNISKASEAVAAHLVESKKRLTVAVKSTVPPGTTRNLVGCILANNSERKKIGLCANPEFWAEGSGFSSFGEPARIVVGACDQESFTAMKRFYESLHGEHLKEIPYLETSPENAEIIKYASNAFLSLKVGFVNEISRICEAVPTADVEVVSRAIGLDKRIGSHFLSAGPGWGGSCFGKDLAAFLKFARDRGLARLDLISGSLSSNEAQKMHVVETLERYAGSLQRKTIAVLGLAFKAGVDDVRDSQSMTVITHLLDKGALVKAYDPLAIKNFRKEFPDDRITYSDSVSDCVNGADVVVLMTESKEFLELKPSFFNESLRGKVVLDARRIYYEKQIVHRGGLQFIFLGVNRLTSAS